MTQFSYQPGPPSVVFRPRHTTHAAMWAWIIGAMQTLLFGCCAATFALMASMPQDELDRAAQQQPGSAEAIALVYPHLRTIAALLLLIGFIPGVMYCVAGFFIRANNKPAIYFTLFLAIAQIFVVGVLLLLNLIGFFINGSLIQLTINILMYGTMLGMLGALVFNLFRSITPQQAATDDQQSDPWNE